ALRRSPRARQTGRRESCGSSRHPECRRLRLSPFGIERIWSMLSCTRWDNPARLVNTPAAYPPLCAAVRLSGTARNCPETPAWRAAASPGCDQPNSIFRLLWVAGFGGEIGRTQPNAQREDGTCYKGPLFSICVTSGNIVLHRVASG